MPLNCVNRSKATHGARLSLSHLHPTVEELLALTRLTEVLDIFPTEAEAVQSYAPPSDDR